MRCENGHIEGRLLWMFLKAFVAFVDIPVCELFHSWTSFPQGGFQSKLVVSTSWIHPPHTEKGQLRPDLVSSVGSDTVPRL